VHLEKLLANRTATSAIRLAGGAASSLFWPQIFADVFKHPVEIIDIKELRTLECAMAAAVVAVEYRDLKEAAKGMVKIKYRIQPNSTNYSVYDRKYELYRKVSGALDGFWKEFN